MLKYILLGFLNYGELSGYDLKSLMEESTSHFWHAYHSQIYTTLRKLEDEGLVISEEIEAGDAKLNRRVYTLTDEGRSALREWIGEPMREMVQVKEDLLVRVFFSGSRDPQATVDELRAQRRLHQQQLDLYNNLASGHLNPLVERTPDMAREAVYWQRTLDFGRRYEQMYIGWLDDSIAEIERL